MENYFGRLPICIKYIENKANRPTMRPQRFAFCDGGGGGGGGGGGVGGGGVGGGRGILSPMMILSS